jgi:hypothetical protein
MLQQNRSWLYTEKPLNGSSPTPGRNSSVTGVPKVQREAGSNLSVSGWKGGRSGPSGGPLMVPLVLWGVQVLHRMVDMHSKRFIIQTLGVPSHISVFASRNSCWSSLNLLLWLAKQVCFLWTNIHILEEKSRRNSQSNNSKLSFTKQILLTSSQCGLEPHHISSFPNTGLAAASGPHRISTVISLMSSSSFSPA